MRSVDKLEANGAVRWQWLGDRRAARGCLSVKPPPEIEMGGAAVRLSKAEELAAREQAKIEEAAQRYFVQREKAKIRMRRVRAQRKG